MASLLDKMLPPEDQKRVIEAIGQAELRSSGEIKVHVEAKCKGGDPYARAVALFEKLGLTKTAERNAVLIYLAVDDRRFSIIGDTGIHAAVGQDFWHGAAAHMRTSFKQGAFGDGLAAAVSEIGERLAERFPRAADDKNEISDDISTDET